MSGPNVCISTSFGSASERNLQVTIIQYEACVYSDEAVRLPGLNSVCVPLSRNYRFYSWTRELSLPSSTKPSVHTCLGAAQMLGLLRVITGTPGQHGA